MIQPGTSAHIHYLDGRIEGPRIVGSRTFPLRVFASGWREFPSLLDKGPPPSPGVYLLTGPAASNPSLLAVRPGEAADLRRRLMEHVQDPTKSGFAEVFAVAAVDDRLSKLDVRYLEARMHEIVGAEAGCRLEVEKIPPVHACPPHERDTLETLLQQARVGSDRDDGHLLVDQGQRPVLEFAGGVVTCLPILGPSET